MVRQVAGREGAPGWGVGGGTGAGAGEELFGRGDVAGQACAGARGAAVDDVPSGGHGRESVEAACGGGGAGTAVADRQGTGDSGGLGEVEGAVGRDARGAGLQHLVLRAGRGRLDSAGAVAVEDAVARQRCGAGTAVGDPEGACDRGGFGEVDGAKGRCAAGAGDTQDLVGGAGGG